MKRVLFLCTHNSARSQMAEGLLRAMAGDRFDVNSAGTEVTLVHPLAIAAMREFGVNISDHGSKHLNDFADTTFDYVITVCDRANEACPYFPGGARRLHWSFEDPSSAHGDEQMRLERFRQVRDAIAVKLREFLIVH